MKVLGFKERVKRVQVAVENGKVVAWTPKAQGGTGIKYTLFSGEQGITCTCPAFRFSRKCQSGEDVCKHVCAAYEAAIWEKLDA